MKLNDTAKIDDAAEMPAKYLMNPIYWGVTFKVPWDFGTMVYLRTRTDPVKLMVTGYHFSPSGAPLCIVSWPDGSDTRHYLIELSTEFIPDYSGEA